MPNENKFLDANGVQYLWSKVNMNDYPNNETLISVIDAIDDSITEVDNRVLNLENGKTTNLLGSYTTIEKYQIGSQSILTADCEWKENAYLLPDGSVSSWENSAYCCMQSYVPVKPQLTYVMFYNQKPINFIHYAFYDSSYRLLVHKTVGTTMAVAPAGAAYLRTSIILSSFGINNGEFAVDENGHITNPTGLLEIYQQSHTNYIPGEYSEREILSKENCYIPWERILTNSIELKHLGFVNEYPAMNLCDPTKLTSGYNNGQNKFGVIWENESYICTEPLSVNGGDKLSFWRLSASKASATPIAIRFITSWDKDCQLIESVPYVTQYTVPENGIYVMVTFSLDTLMNDKKLAYIQRYDITDIYQGYKLPLENICKIQQDAIDGNVSTTLHVCLPPEICIPSGKTVELYNNECCLEADKYHIQWIGDYGTAYDWKYSITGNDNLIGKDFTLTMNIINDNLDVMEQTTTTIKFVSSTITNSQLIIPIGDSLTNGKSWLKEIYATLSNNKIAFRGTRGTTDPSLVNGITHEGRSGAGTDWYNLNSSYAFDENGLSTLPDVTSNPFWNTNTNSFDFDYYCNSVADGGAGYFQDATKNNISITPTGVLIFLGANGVQLDATPAVTDIVTLINNIRKSDKGASIPIFVVNTHYRAPYIVATSADGFETNSAGDYKFENDVKYQNLMIKLNNTLIEMENVFIVPVNVTHDSAHNFPYVMENVNPYNTSEQIKKYTDTIHPSEAGYKQMAVTMFGSICAHAQ